jgi:hypothetical protein
MNNIIDENIKKMEESFQDCLDTLQFITKGYTKDLEIKKYKYVCNKYAENIEELNMFLQNLDDMGTNSFDYKISINISGKNSNDENITAKIDEDILDTNFINDLIITLINLKERQYTIYSDLFERYKRLKNNTH